MHPRGCRCAANAILLLCAIEHTKQRPLLLILLLAAAIQSTNLLETKQKTPMLWALI